MNKHTRGSWAILPEEADKEYIRIRGTVLGERYKIANVLSPAAYKNHPEFALNELEESRANARLIAAAPELLEALKDARTYIESTTLNATSAKTRSNYRGCLYRIDAAINKAEGKS